MDVLLTNVAYDIAIEESPKERIFGHFWGQL